MSDLMREGSALAMPADGCYDLPLSAGRDLDARIAEKVMGWRRIAVPIDAHGKNAGVTLVPPTFDERNYAWAPLGKYDLAAFAPHYSTDIAAAWLVVEQMHRNGWKIDVQNRASGWACHVGFPGPDNRHVFEHHETIPLAICRAALAAVEGIA